MTPTGIRCSRSCSTPPTMRGYLMHGTGGAGLAAMVIAASVALASAGVLPRWMLWVGLLVGIAALASIMFFTIWLWLLWIAAASVLLFLRFETGTVGALAWPSNEAGSDRFDRVARTKANGPGRQSRGRSLEMVGRLGRAHDARHRLRCPRMRVPTSCCQKYRKQSRSAYPQRGELESQKGGAVSPPGFDASARRL